MQTPLLNSLTKGSPLTEQPLRREDVGRQGWSILAEDLPFPVAVIRKDALDANRAWMQAFLSATGVELCPHGKTTMSPDLFALQMADGVFGLTCATASHLEVYRAAGVKRVIFANQLVGRTNLAMVLRHLRDPDFELYCLIDSQVGLQLIADSARSLGLQRPVKLLVEIGASGGRTGVRSLSEALDLTRAAMARPEVAVAGVETYEGVFSGADPASREAPILALLGRTIEAANAIAALTPATEEPFLLTAGGSDFFDLVVEGFKGAVAGRATRIVLRGGCYLTHDSLHYQRCFERMRRRTPSITAIPGGLQSALEVWSIVQSRPEPTRAYCSLGKRDISNDWEPPTPTYWFRPGHHERPHTAPSSWRTAALNDQHLHLEIASEDDIRVGDLMAFGVSHPCTTFDKWRTMMVVDEDRRVIDAIGTWF